MSSENTIVGIPPILGTIPSFPVLIHMLVRIFVGSQSPDAAAYLHSSIVTRMISCARELTCDDSNVELLKKGPDLHTWRIELDVLYLPITAARALSQLHF
ncbi:hypothetical protein F5880DRAFT_1616615 [Lentinula raphanica]|nr:hypothetical protein F5880DRAFT_1616615 [Lentinula raphanica]